MFAILFKPRSRREGMMHPELPYHRFSTSRYAINPGAAQGSPTRVARVKFFVVRACRHMGSSLRTCLRILASCFPSMMLTDSDAFSEFPCPSMEEVERLLAEIESADMEFPNQDYPRSPIASEMRPLSPSIMPERCATAPEICLWAARFRPRLQTLKNVVVFNKQKSGDVTREVAIMNSAYQTRWYSVSEGKGVRYPQGTTGRKLLRPKLPCGAKGLKRIGQWDVPEDKDVYTPTKGVSRRLENRPPDRGWWFYPRPSSLRKELKPDPKSEIGDVKDMLETMLAQNKSRIGKQPLLSNTSSAADGLTRGVWNAAIVNDMPPGGLDVVELPDITVNSLRLRLLGFLGSG
ncbi:hypothetical protein IWZ00DRAFT_544995 [Phyllosticta capitalensis]